MKGVEFRKNGSQVSLAPLTVEKLALLQKEQCGGVIGLQISQRNLPIIIGGEDGYNLWDGKRAQVTGLLKSTFPNLQSIILRLSSQRHGPQCLSLLHCLPVSIRRLSIYSLSEASMVVVSQVLKEIRRFHQLEYLKFYGLKASPEVFRVFSGTLEELPSLKSLVVREWHLIDPDACWTIMVEALKDNKTLTQVDIDRQGQQFDQEDVEHANAYLWGLRRYRMEDHHENALQYWPGVNKAKLKVFQGDMDELVNAMVAVRDRFELFHILLAKLPTNAWLKEEYLRGPATNNNGPLDSNELQESDAKRRRLKYSEGTE